MAAPTVNGTPTSGTNLFATTHTVTLPSSIVAGELLIVFIGINNGETLSTPSGWSVMSGFPALFATSYRVYCFIKYAAGSDTCAPTSANSAHTAYTAFRLSAPEGISNTIAAESSGSTPDPPSHSMDVAHDAMWFAIYGALAGYSSGPSTYNNGWNARAGASIGVAASYKSITNTQTENPGTFSIDSSASHRTATIAFYNLGSPTGTGAVTAPATAFASNGSSSVSVTGTGSVTAPKTAFSGFTDGAPILFVYIDWDADGTFDAGDEVTADVLAAGGVTWTRGRSADFSSDAQGMASFSLRNTTGAYSTNPDLIPGRPVLIKSRLGGDDFAHFYGYIQRVTPSATLGAPVGITCYDPFRRMSDTSVVVERAEGPRSMRVAILDDYERGGLNLVRNPSFETDAAGWYATGGAVNRIAGDAAPGCGSACGEFALSGGGPYIAWCEAPFTPVVREGLVYRASVWLKSATGYTQNIVLQLGYRNTNPKGYSVAQVGTTWSRHSVTFIPFETRHPGSGTGSEYLVLELSPSAGSFRIDGAQVTRGPEPWPFGTSGRWPNWLPEGGTFEGITYWNLVSPATAVYQALSGGKYGPTCLAVDTNGAGSGTRRLLAEALYAPGQAYSASVWLKSPNSMPYDVAFGELSSADHAHATGTLTADVWTKVVVNWTPTDWRAGSSPGVYLQVTHTDAAARTFNVDGVRVIPGATDEYELGHWVFPATEGDELVGGATPPVISSSALAALDKVNTVAGAHHFIRATASAPYYQYVVVGRADLAAKTVAEYFDDDFRSFDQADVDIASVVNIVPMWRQNPMEDGIVYYGDEASVGLYGPRASGVIGAADFFLAGDHPDDVAAKLLARYKDPSGHPTMTVQDRWPSQLVRDLDDLISASVGRLGYVNRQYLIVKTTTTVNGKGLWVTQWVLEEYSN